VKIAIALRTCGKVFNYWNNNTRIVDVDKETIILTCLNSLLKSIKASKYTISLSIHDDSSSTETLAKINDLCQQYGISYDLIHSGVRKNFQTQYEWIKQQDCNYVYCVEDDYLHVESAIDDMVDMCEFMKQLLPSEYAVYPFNNPHRYTSFDMLYAVYVLKGPKGYWRSSFHSTHTFFITKQAFDQYDEIMHFQAYAWATDADWLEDSTINKIWNEQQVKLMSPINSLAYHMADSTQEEPFADWRKLWNENLV
jgi:hypothetical protein